MIMLIASVSSRSSVSLCTVSWSKQVSDTLIGRRFTTKDKGFRTSGTREQGRERHPWPQQEQGLAQLRVIVFSQVTVRQIASLSIKALEFLLGTVGGHTESVPPLALRSPVRYFAVPVEGMRCSCARRRVEQLTNGVSVNGRGPELKSGSGVEYTVSNTKVGPFEEKYGVEGGDNLRPPRSAYEHP